MDKKNLRIIFMGTPDFSNQALLSLIKDGYNIISAYTQPDKKVGRKQIFQKSPVKMTAEDNDIPVFQPTRLKEEIENIKKQKPDLIIVAAYGKIIPQEILDIPQFKCVNIHPSLLPKYRGASPIQNALLNGETETGTTIMLMTQEVDAGDILAQIKILIDPQEKLPELSSKLSFQSARLLTQILPNWIDGKIKPKKQIEAEATFCQMLEKKDGQVSWEDSAEPIFNRYRAFFPWPGIFTFWDDKRLKISNINLIQEDFPEEEIGSIFSYNEKILIKTKSKAIELKKVQLEGKNEVAIKDFILGYPNFIGSVLK